MAAKSPDIDNSHDVFACEVIRRLNEYYNISVELPQTPEGVSYCTDHIHWGIITISYLFRKEYFKIFNGLGTKLMHLRSFKKCCMTVPVKKNNRYFFNFLKRVSTIHEMAVFSYRRGSNFFEAARHCLAQFQDKDYFDSTGSWQRLEKIGYFFAQSSKLMRPVMDQERLLRCPVRFTLAVEMIETRLEEEENEEMLGSEEMCFLRDQREKFIAREVALEDSKNIPCPVERKPYTDDQQSHSQRQNKENNQLGSVEDEIKAIKEFLVSLSESHKSCEGMKEKIINKTEQSNLERSCMKDESSDLIEFDRLSDLEAELTASIREKLYIKSKLDPNYDEWVSIEDDTEGYSLDSSGSSMAKFVTCTNMNEKGNVSDFKQLEEDLYLSESSLEENSPQHHMKKSQEDYYLVDSGSHESSDFVVSESHSSTRYTGCSNEDEDYLKMLEQDLYVKAANFEFISYSDYSDSESSQQDSEKVIITINSRTKEDNKRMLDSILFSGGKTESLIAHDSSSISEVKDIMLPLEMPCSSASASFPDKVDSGSSSETDNDEHEVTLSKSENPDAAHECSKNSNANIEDSQTNPKSRQRKGKRRKKKGKGKK